MSFKNFFLFTFLLSSFFIKGSSSLTTPQELLATKNGRITQKEATLLKNLADAVNSKNYNQAYAILDDLYSFIKSRSELFISEIPIIVNPVGQEISRMIQVTRSNQIDSILTLGDKVEATVGPLKKIYYDIMRDYHNQPKDQRTKEQTHLADHHVEAEQIYSNIIVPADRIEDILTKVERLFILAHLRNYYFLTTKTGEFGSERSNITGQHYNPNIGVTNQQSTSSKEGLNPTYP